MVDYARNCDAGRLRRLLNDTLEQGEEGPLVAHLSDCEECQNALETLAAENRRWESLREYVGGEPENDAQVDCAFRDERPSVSCISGFDDDEGDPSILSLLDPPENDGTLGRLGSYDVLGVVGRGGMGIVLKGFDKGLGRTVAIKVMGPEPAFLSSARKRFAREARAAASVVHEHVVAIHAVDSWNGLPYLVMHFVAGVSLQERINGHGPLAVPEILRISKQVAAGLAAAHEQGLVHRDIKPSNILLENGVERVKITDFGLARAISDASLSQSGVVSGTPQYMAPEQTRCEQVDPRADLFSLGSVMYAMCTGHSPFRAETTMAVLRRVCEDTPRPIRQLNPEIPPWLADLIAKLLAKKPDERFPSASYVEELLGRCLTYLELPREGPPPFQLSANRRARRKNWAMITVGALVVIAGLGAALIRGPYVVAEFVASVLGARRADISRAAPSNPFELRNPDDERDLSRWVPVQRGRNAVAVEPGGPADDARHRPQRFTALMARLLRPIAPKVTDGIAPWPFGIVSSARYSADGKLLALACGDGSVTLCDASTGEIRAVLSGRGGRVWSIAFSPDSKALVTTAGEWSDKNRVGQVKLWDVATATFRTSLSSACSLPLAVAYSTDGKSLGWAGRDRTINLCDTQKMDVRAICRGHDWTVRSLVFHPEQPVIVSAGLDGTIRFWDTRTGEPIGEPIRHDGRSSNCVAISPDGRLLAANSGPRSDEPDIDREIPGWITVWDWSSRKEIRRLVGCRFDILGVAFSPDGQSLASAGGFYTLAGEVKLWDVASGTCRQDLKGHHFWVESVAFSPDGKKLVSAGGAEPGRGEVRVWDLSRP